MRNSFIFILFILSFQGRVFAQQPAYFLFGEDQFEGIDIYNIIQDHDHNYWFATDQGLFMHDGYQFEKIECEEMNANSVFNFAIDSKGIIYCSNLSQQVFKIEKGVCSLIFNIPDTGVDLYLMVNQKDELYIATSKKVYVLNSKHELIHAPNISNNAMLGPPYMLKDGSIIQHYSNESNLSVYKNGSFKIKAIKNYSNLTASDYVLHFTKIGSLLYAIDNFNKDIYTFDEINFTASNSLKKLDTEKSLLRFYPIQNMLWVGNNISGLFVLNENLKPNHKESQIFTDYFISYVYQDHEGNILLATFDQGIVVIPDKNIVDVDPEFSNYKVTRIVKGGENELYLGTRDGGILKYNGKITTISESSNKSVEFLYYWSDQNIIIEDTKKLTAHLSPKKNQSLAFGSLKDISRVNSTQLLFALNSGLSRVSYESQTETFTKDTLYLSERAYCVVVEPKSSGIYVSTASGLRYSNGKSEFDLLTYKGRTISVFDLVVYQGKTFAASSRQGILFLHNGKVLKKITPIYNKTPLTIFKLVIKDDRIYANTQIGLVILNMEGEITNFLNKSNGLTANKIIDFELFQNQLWVTHARGIQRFNLNEIHSKVHKPVILLRNILINNTKVDNIVNAGQFNSDQRNFKFSFHVPTLRHRENIRYHFKLEGNLKDWSINNYENHEVEYNALAPGRYRFIVKAENNGVFSDPIYYSFTISAPYYQRWWFIALITLACIIVVSAVYIRQLNIHKKKAQQINELNASRLTAIQSQMNPHFIFNSLNSIQDLVLKGDIDNSYTFITKFSNLVRRTLNYSDKDFIDFEQEIKLIELYLSLEKLRFKDELEYTINSNDIDDIQIPPMLIQPFIENALIHGLLHKVGTKKLSINFTLGDVLICEITDNGIGREKAQEIKTRQGDNHESFAVNAIKRRFTILMNHYKGQLGFSIDDIVSEEGVVGTKVTLRIPIQLKY